MSQYDSSIAIMFPANYPADKPDAHCTLIWLGDTETFMFSKNELLEILNNFDYTPDPEYKPMLPKIFGKDDERVVVLPLADPHGSLQALRTHIETALGKLGITSPSEYMTYVPHVTTEPYIPGVTKLANYPVPEAIKLGKAELWWGDEHVTD